MDCTVTKCIPMDFVTDIFGLRPAKKSIWDGLTWSRYLAYTGQKSAPEGTGRVYFATNISRPVQFKQGKEDDNAWGHFKQANRDMVNGDCHLVAVLRCKEGNNAHPSF